MLHCTANTSAVSKTSLKAHSMTEQLCKQQTEKPCTASEAYDTWKKVHGVVGQRKSRGDKRGAHSAPGLSVVGWCMKG